MTWVAVVLVQGVLKRCLLEEVEEVGEGSKRGLAGTVELA